MNIQSIRHISLFGANETECIPTGTYRLQFHKDFTFAAAIDIIPYLSALGISHVYASPILTARPGSVHGYDTVDYAAINPELGGEAGFVALAQALRLAGIGIILDIVPNHMAITGGHNRYWQDVLRNGVASHYAAWFDIDFNRPDARLNGRVHLPFLGEPYRTVLERGDIDLTRADDGSHVLRYGAHVFPIRPDHEQEIALRGLAAYDAIEERDSLISRQHYVLDWWRNAGDRINWRRFFDVTELAAVRMEVPEAFNACHAIPFRLYRDGLIDGLRIDHVDGLADPAAYCQRLRASLAELQRARPAGRRAERAWVIVEKILAPGEAVPPEWDVAGTTGYDFMDEVSALQHDATAEPVMAAIWEAVSGRSRAFEREETIARREILGFSFAGQRDCLVDALIAASPVVGIIDIPSRQSLTRAVELILSEMRAYRSYATAEAPVAGPYLDRAIERARAIVLRDDPAIDLITAVMSGPVVADAEGVRATAMRQFNQLSAPLAAKAVEDTAFYRYGRLLSRNDVGFHAAELAMPPAAFHERMVRRARAMPQSLLATATHDHKRGEDVRARLAVLSELPERLAIDAGEWLALAAETGPSLDPSDAYMIFQMIIGAWDPELEMDDVDGRAALAERLCGWMTKALREGKLRSSWTSPDEAYEARACAFICHVLFKTEASAARRCIERLLTATMAPAAANGLAQTVLRLTLPGVPDTYQGTEFWDFSLVDPDNRRPVDFGARHAALSDAQGLPALGANWRNGHIKQALIQRLLRLRQADPQLFAKGDYQPVDIMGARSAHVLAFLRRSGNRGLLVAVGRLLAQPLGAADRLTPDPAWWEETMLDLSGHRLSRRMTLEPVIGPAQIGGDLPVGNMFADVPVAVWKLSNL